MKLFKKLGLFALVLTGVLGLASCNDGARTEMSDVSSRSLMSSTQARVTVTDEDIANYIKGRTGLGKTYYLYDVIVNRTSSWELITETEVYYEDDEMGEIYASDYDFEPSLTFKKEKAYLLDMLNYSYLPGCPSSEAITEANRNLEASLEVLGIYGTTYNALKAKCESFMSYGNDFDCRYDDEYDYIFPTADRNVCQAIADKYRNKMMNEIYDASAYKWYSLGDPLLFIPNEDFTLNLDRNKIVEYPGAKLEIRSADITPLDFTDTTAPSITGENIYINVDNPLTFEQIKSHFSAHDETDGDITDRLSFTDNTYILTNGKIACGTYSFKVSVSDAAGNTTTKLYYAHVVDYTDPTIKGSTIHVSYTKLLSSSEIKNLFTYSDNYTPTNQLLFRIIEDKYTSTYQNLGAHTITAKIIDQQGNEATAVSTVNVIDDKAPFMVLPENLKITTLDNWSLDDFKSLITITDEKEGNITNFELQDLDGYLMNTKKAGTYRIKVIAADSAGNKIENSFSFLNEDKDMPSIAIDPDYIMVVNKGDSITKEQVINYFIRTGQLTLEEAETIEVISVYFDVEPQAGFYTLRLSNEYKVIESKIKVLDDGSTEEPVNPDKPLIPEDNKFFSTEGYVDNFLKPASWSIYHYLTILGALVVLVVVIVIIIKKK